MYEANAQADDQLDDNQTGETNARTPIYGDGTQALAGVAAQDDGTTQARGDAERGGAERQQGSRQPSGEFDGSRVSKARGGRDGAARDNLSSTGARRIRSERVSAKSAGNADTQETAKSVVEAVQ